MKEYRLTGWPVLAPAFHRTAYRRMLSDMSQRFVTVARLVKASGLKPHEVRAFVEMLEARGLIAYRETLGPRSASPWSLRPFGGWLRRAISSSHHR